MSYFPDQVLAERSVVHFEVGDVDKAIKDMEEIVKFSGEPRYLLRLAELYRYRGRMDEYNATLDQANQMARVAVRRSSLERNVLALGRIAELQGVDPKQLLSIHYKVFIENQPDFVPARVAAGDLAYSKGSYNIAAGYYTDALELDEKNQNALAGLAECYWQSDDERLGQTLERLLEINPHHPRAHAIQTEKLLDVGKTAEALKLIDSVLAVNPNRLRFRALKSAALFLDDELTAMGQVQTDTLGFNPVCSEVFRVPGRIASRHYRFKRGAAFQRRALELDPSDHEAQALLAYDLLRLGNEQEGRQELEKAFELDPYNVQVFNMLKVLDTLADYSTVKRGPFILQLPQNEVPILAEDALALLEDAADQFQRAYHIALETPIYVQMFDNHDDFMVRSIGLPGNIGHLGICFGPLVTMDSPSVRKKGPSTWRSVLWHEFAHVATLQKTNHRMPRWLSEGISVYEQERRSPASGQRMEAGYKAIIAHESLPGLSDLESYFTQAKTPQHLQFGYFLAGEFVKFYVDEYGFNALVDALDRIGRKSRTEQALVAASGTSLRKVNAGYKGYLKRRFAPYDNLPDAPKTKESADTGRTGRHGAPGERPPWLEIGAPFTDAMRNAAEAVDAQRWDEAEKELKRAYELFPEYTGDDGPLQKLAGLYERLGRKKELEQILRDMLQFDEADFGACEKLVTLYREENNWPEVAEIAEWAMGIDPFAIPMRKTLLDAYLQTGDDTAALDNVAHLAHLDPVHVSDYRMQRTEILMRLEQWDSARKEILAVLEETPHYWKAQQMLLSIVERDKGEDADAQASPTL
jgi:tetratricopeptide (TPR) repeat protein